MSPETIGKYRLGAPLGESGRGVVFRGVDPDTNRTVAVKVLPPEKFSDGATRKKFLEAARAATRVSHPHLRQLYEAGESSQTIYLVMEYLEGATLKTLLVGGPVAVGTALAWGAEMADALAAAHARGAVHGDLRPARVFITAEGTMKVMDTGMWWLAPHQGVDLSQEKKLLASNLAAPAVAALTPEQIHGREPDARSDIFALGAVLYQMLTGRQPFLGRNLEQTMHWVLRHQPEPPSRLVANAPWALDRVLARALEKKPEARFHNAAEMAAALRAVAAGEELPAEVVKQAAARSLGPLWWGLGALATLLMLWFAYLALTRP